MRDPQRLADIVRRRRQSIENISDQATDFLELSDADPPRRRRAATADKASWGVWRDRITHYRKELEEE